MRSFLWQLDSLVALSRIHLQSYLKCKRCLLVWLSKDKMCSGSSAVGISRTVTVQQ